MQIFNNPLLVCTNSLTLTCCSKINFVCCCKCKYRIKPVDSDIWVKAYLDESMEPETFYPGNFKEWTDDILEEDFDLRQDQICVQGIVPLLTRH